MALSLELHNCALLSLVGIHTSVIKLTSLQLQLRPLRRLRRPWRGRPPSPTSPLR
jgi:hypothetical protein